MRLWNMIYTYKKHLDIYIVFVKKKEIKEMIIFHFLKKNMKDDIIIIYLYSDNIIMRAVIRIINH